MKSHAEKWTRPGDEVEGGGPVVGEDADKERLVVVGRDVEVVVDEVIFDTFGLGFRFPVANRYAFRRSISSFSPVIRNFAVLIICSRGCTFPFNLVKPSVGLSSCGNHRH